SAASRTHVPSLTSHAFFRPMSSAKLQQQRGGMLSEADEEGQGNGGFGAGRTYQRAPNKFRNSLIQGPEGSEIMEVPPSVTATNRDSLAPGGSMGDGSKRDTQGTFTDDGSKAGLTLGLQVGTGGRYDRHRDVSVSPTGGTVRTMISEGSQVPLNSPSQQSVQEQGVGNGNSKDRPVRVGG